jgi:hypothetical protein
MSFLEYPGDPNNWLEAMCLYTLMAFMGIGGVFGIIVDMWLIYKILLGT